LPVAPVTTIVIGVVPSVSFQCCTKDGGGGGKVTVEMRNFLRVQIVESS
jgi:hypothetical protein